MQYLLLFSNQTVFDEIANITIFSLNSIKKSVIIVARKVAVKWLYQSRLKTRNNFVSI